MLAGADSFAASITNADGLQPARLDAEVRDSLLGAWSSLVPSKPGLDLIGDVQTAIRATLEARERLERDLGDPAAPRPSGTRR